MQGHSDYVRSVSFNPDGSVLASGSDDNSIKLWSMPDGQLIKNLTVSHGDTRVVRVCVCV
jgi:WD40 repeat protein